MANDLLGWASTAILGLSLVQQLVGQWRDRGIVHGPPALLAGYMLAALGLGIYAFLKHAPVFGVASALVLLSTLGSLWIARRNRFRRRRTIPTRRSDVIPFRPRHILLKRQGSNR